MALSLRKVFSGEIKGWLSEEVLRLLPTGFLNDPVSSILKMNGKVLKESRWRWAAIFHLPNGQAIFVKRDKTKGWFEFLKYLVLPSRARKEWFVDHQAQKRNLPVPKPFGWLERVHRGFVTDSYYLSEAIVSGRPLIEIPRPPVSELAKTVKKIHLGGLFHRDLHAGNFVWDGNSIFLVDLHSAKIVKALSLKQRLWNLSMLFHSLRSRWGEKEQSLFMDRYFEGEPAHLQRKGELLQRIHLQMERLQKRQWRSRTKRCLKESTEFTIRRERGAHYYHRRDFSLEKTKKLIEEHLQLVEQNPSALVKNAPEVSVSVWNQQGEKLCVKQFRNINFWQALKDHFRRPRGLRGWVGSNGVRARGIPSLRALALVEKRRWWGLQESFFLTESPNAGKEMDRYILEHLDDIEKKGLLTKAFARWLSDLHHKRVFHRDMKTCNILISDNTKGCDFYLLDQEDISLNVKVDSKKLFKTFLQLNTSTPKAITTKDRFRFFKEYHRLNPVVKDRKNFLRRLIEESKRRNLVYVTPWGVVTEKL